MEDLLTEIVEIIQLLLVLHTNTIEGVCLTNIHHRVDVEVLEYDGPRLLWLVVHS